MKTEIATFAMGCFWQPEYKLSKVKGIISVVPGFMGGNEKLFPNPTSKQVYKNNTGYAEAVNVVFDPSIITYNELLDLFWKNHDPTQLNRQGPDIGKHYRSAIFYRSGKQKKEALASKKKWEARLMDKKLKIVTEITKASTFYPAEDFHRNFIARTGWPCHISRSPFK